MRNMDLWGVFELYLLLVRTKEFSKVVRGECGVRGEDSEILRFVKQRFEVIAYIQGF